MNIESTINSLYPQSHIHHVPCYEPYMTYIKEGKKTVEGRVGTPYYTKIHKGDFLRLYNRTMEIWCLVMRTHLYPSFQEMLEGEGLKKMLPQASSVEEGVRIYRGFPSFADKEGKFGAFAMEVKNISLSDLKREADNKSFSRDTRPVEEHKEHKYDHHHHSHSHHSHHKHDREEDDDSYSRKKVRL